MAYNFKKEEEVKQFLENLAIEYRFGCFHEKKPEVCHLLGDYFEAISQDFKKALAVYKNNCDTYNNSHSCYKTGAYYMQGKALPSINDDKAMEYFDKGCKLGNAQACYKAGMLSLYSENRTRDYTQGLAYYEEACNKGIGDSCFDLSSVYISGEETHIARDMVKAAHFSAKACDLDNPDACKNLSRMYLLGHGVEQNYKLSEKYRIKAADLVDQVERAQEIPFQLGIDSV